MWCEAGVSCFAAGRVPTISHLKEFVSTQSLPLPYMKTAVWKSLVSSGMSQMIEYSLQSVVPRMRSVDRNVFRRLPLRSLGWKSSPALGSTSSDLAQTLMRTVWPRYFRKTSRSYSCFPHHMKEYFSGGSDET